MKFQTVNTVPSLERVRSKPSSAPQCSVHYHDIRISYFHLLLSLKVSKLPDDNDACTMSHNQGVGIKNVAGSLLVFKNGALMAWPRKREEKRERHRERERERGGEHTIVIMMCVQEYISKNVCVNTLITYMSCLHTQQL